MILSFFTFLLSCNGNRKKDISNASVKETYDTIELMADTKSENNSLILEESFIDSLNIGIQGKYKIELQKFRSSDSVFVEINFFEKKSKKWIKKQYFEFLKDGILGCNVKIEDFNNDGLSDMTFQSSIAARGANEVRKLFIFNKNKGELVFIKNSEEYPNLLYNKELNCIDAWLVTGGSSTVFLKIEQDSLREFAGISLDDGQRVIYLIKKNGQRVILKEDKAIDGVHVRYSNYKTLKLNEVY